MSQRSESGSCKVTVVRCFLGYMRRSFNAHRGYRSQRCAPSPLLEQMSDVHRFWVGSAEGVGEQQNCVRQGHEERCDECEVRTERGRSEWGVRKAWPRNSPGACLYGATLVVKRL